MPVTNIDVRELKFTKCDTNGRCAEGSCPHHWYIVLSRRGYNQKSKNLLGVPLTSKVTDYSLNYGINITNDDIEEGDFTFDKQPTFILCDRPCRLKKEYLKDSPNNVFRISKSKLREIADKISMFIKFGK